MRGRLFGALYTGTGPGGHVHRDMATIIRCIVRSYRQRHVEYMWSTHNAEDAGTAMRRRQRRLRQWLRHERLSVAMALAHFTHHSSRGQRMARVGGGHEKKYTAEFRRHPHPKSPARSTSSSTTIACRISGARGLTVSSTSGRGAGRRQCACRHSPPHL